MAYKDPLDERARAARRKHYYENKNQYLERNRKKRKQLREFIDAVKSYPCLDCNNSYPPWVMHFDHLPGEGKVNNIAQMISTSWVKIIIEIMKCEIVCANCHAERTHGRLTSG